MIHVNVDLRAPTVQELVAHLDQARALLVQGFVDDQDATHFWERGGFILDFQGPETDLEYVLSSGEVFATLRGALRHLGFTPDGPETWRSPDGQVEEDGEWITTLIRQGRLHQRLAAHLR